MERVSFESLLSIATCLLLALLAHIQSLPVWVPIIVALCGAIRLTLAWRGGGAPPRSVLLTVAVLVVALMFLRYRTFNGLPAGTALLCLMMGLKLLEASTRRDMYILTLGIYFLCIAALLESESFWLLGYLVGVCWLTSATLLRLTSGQPAPAWRSSLQYGVRILAQALPLTVVFWLLFPRLGGPLWALPVDSDTAESGLGDTMSPGDITQLAQSDEIAFRVHFLTPPPPPQEMYWRGPVFNDFNGRTWRGSLGVTSLGLTQKNPSVQPQGPAYRYVVSLEPHQHVWVFALDWLQQWNLPRGNLTADHTLVAPYAISRPVDVTATSFTQASFRDPLSDRLRRTELSLPNGDNPRTRQLAQSLRVQHPDDMDLASAVLQMFAQQPYFYTLTPPKLADDSVDQFLFETKRGFCGHYASAFAVLMRAAGIPARVVTGYQGGTFNRFSDYWILRQSNAHAWDEIWIEGRGWIRIDPTAAIAPERVERDVSDSVSADTATVTHWRGHSRWLADARLRFDALRELWRERVLTFNQDSQARLMEMLHIPDPDGEKLVLVLAAALALVFVWLTWQVRRELNPHSADLTVRSYMKLCAKLAAAGLPRRAHEGAEAYAARVAALRPDLAAQLESLCRYYSNLRFAPPAGLTAAQFQALVRGFKPGRARPGRAGPGDAGPGDATPQDSRASRGT
jgi:transglutaminase-like putative cysteine protease